MGVLERGVVLSLVWRFPAYPNNVGSTMEDDSGEDHSRGTRYIAVEALGHLEASGTQELFGEDVSPR